MTRRNRSKDDLGPPAWYGRLQPAPFRTFGEAEAERVVAMAKALAPNMRRRASLPSKLALGTAVALFVVACGWFWRQASFDGRQPIAAERISAERNEYARQDVRFEYPAEWTVIEVPEQPDRVKDAALASQVELLEKQIPILQDAYELIHSPEQREQSRKTLANAKQQVKELRQQVEENRKRLAEAPPKVVFRSKSDSGSTSLGTFRTIIGYGFASSSLLDAYFPANAERLDPDAREVSRIRFRYAPENGHTGRTATHYYLMQGTRTYEFAFYDDVVSDETAERIVRSFSYLNES